MLIMLLVAAIALFCMEVMKLARPSKDTLVRRVEILSNLVERLQAPRLMPEEDWEDGR